MYETIDRPFEQICDQTELELDAERIAATATLLAHTAMRFSDVTRVPRYADGERESDVEHSYMLALVAPEIAVMLGLDYDVGLISQYAIVHDLIELRTDDQATFIISDQQLMAKHEREHAELHSLVAELPPHTGTLLLGYEAQADPESRFVKLIDKLLPIIVDILGQGNRVMHEDFNVHTRLDLASAHQALRERIARTFGEEFPYVVMAHEILTKMYEDVFVEHLSCLHS